jgi:glycosyltransferase involved in cell wall biosynthesis
MAVEENKATPGLIGWKVAKLSLNVASVRYRALLPMLALKESGKNCRVFADYDLRNLENLSVLVIVKGLVPDDLALAQQAHSRGIPIILDLCDCIFVDNYGGQNYSVAPAVTFAAMAELATAVVVSTEPLAEVVRNQIAGHVPIFVIPDGVDSCDLQTRAQKILEQSVVVAKSFQVASAPKSQPDGRFNLPELTGWEKIRKKASRKYKKLLTAVRTEGVGAILKLHLWKISRIPTKPFRRPKVTTPAHTTSQKPRSTETPATTVAAKCNAKRILWFGNHGAPYARFGMLDLLEIKDSLELIAGEMDVKLVVISDNQEKYLQHIKPLKIKSEYIAWSPTVVEQEFARASVVVIPNPLETFSICKSANRATFALKHGVPVVATATPALRPLAECIVLDDFENGLRTYLTGSRQAKADIERGQKLIEVLYGQSQTLREWSQVIERVVAGSKQSARSLLSKSA